MDDRRYGNTRMKFIKEIFSKIFRKKEVKINVEADYKKATALTDKNAHLKDLRELVDKFYDFHLLWGGQSTSQGRTIGLAYLMVMAKFLERKKQYEDFDILKN